MATVKSKLEDAISISSLVTLMKCLTEAREGRVIWAQSSRKFCTTKEETSGAEVPATRSRDGEGHFRPSTAFKGVPLVTYMPQLAPPLNHSKQEPVGDVLYWVLTAEMHSVVKGTAADTSRAHSGNCWCSLSAVMYTSTPILLRGMRRLKKTEECTHGRFREEDLREGSTVEFFSL